VLAAAIADEERTMGRRLEENFDVAVEASLRELEPADVQDKLDAYLRDCHALEEQAMALLEGGRDMVEDSELAATMRSHLAETRTHLERVDQALERRGSKPSKAKDALLKVGGANLGAFFGAQPDTTTKLAAFAYAFENLEVAAYGLLERVAERAGEADVARMAAEILAGERRAAEAIAKTWDRPGVPLGKAA
jgi:ferritin-like metal-binding protein YciE